MPLAHHRMYCMGHGCKGSWLMVFTAVWTFGVLRALVKTGCSFTIFPVWLHQAAQWGIHVSPLTVRPTINRWLSTHRFGTPENMSDVLSSLAPSRMTFVWWWQRRGRTQMNWFMIFCGRKASHSVSNFVVANSFDKPKLMTHNGNPMAHVVVRK